MTHHLAQINVGRLLAPPDDPRVAEFVNALDEINALADTSDGFVWRLQDESGNALAIREFEDPTVALNLSVWESVESLHAFTYRSAHAAFFKRRALWFEPPPDVITAMWWVPVGHVPTPAEGGERLDLLRSEGPTQQAFTFAQRFPPPDATS